MSNYNKAQSAQPVQVVPPAFDLSSLASIPSLIRWNNEDVQVEDNDPMMSGANNVNKPFLFSMSAWDNKSSDRHPAVLPDGNEVQIPNGAIVQAGVTIIGQEHFVLNHLDQVIGTRNVGLFTPIAVLAKSFTDNKTGRVTNSKNWIGVLWQKAGGVLVDLPLNGGRLIELDKTGEQISKAKITNRVYGSVTLNLYTMNKTFKDKEGQNRSFFVFKTIGNTFGEWLKTPQDKVSAIAQICPAISQYCLAVRDKKNNDQVSNTAQEQGQASAPTPDWAKSS